TEGLDVDVGHAHQIGTATLVELIQVGLVLEEVGIQTTFGDLQVRLHVVGEDLDIQLHALFGQSGFDELADLRVGNTRGGDAEFRSRVAATRSGQRQASYDLFQEMLRKVRSVPVIALRDSWTTRRSPVLCRIGTNTGRNTPVTTITSVWNR